MARFTFHWPVVVIAFLASNAAAGDWPHLRGPNYDAVSKEIGLAERWPAVGPVVLWERELGEGYSGFVVAEGRALTQFQTAAGQYIVALDPKTGADIWRRRVDWRWQSNGAYPGPYATPTFDAGRVYYSTPAGRVGCLHSATGAEVWSVNVIEKFKGRGAEFGYAATPLVENGRVYLPAGGLEASMVALNADTGAAQWAEGGDQASYCSAFPITLHGRRLIVGYLRNAITVHDSATGERMWRHELSSNYDEHSAWPLYAEPSLFFTAPFHAGAQMFQLEARGPSVAAKLTWSRRHFSNDVCSSVLIRGHVYGFDLQQMQSSEHRTSRGKLKCLDFQTGAMKWETADVAHCTLIAADGKLILLTDTGDLILARENPERYEELARAHVLSQTMCWTPPTLSDGRLFVRDHATAKCFDLRSSTASEDLHRAAPVSRGFDWSTIVPIEPDYPHDAPAVSEVGWWFTWCLGGVFVPAGIISYVVSRHSAVPNWFAATTFFVLAFALGATGTTVYSSLVGSFVFTWPSVVYLAFRLAVAASARAKSGKRHHSMARAVVVLFLVVCFGYYAICRLIGYMIGWYFLAGVLPAFPLAVVAEKTRTGWSKIAVELLTFSAYFWLSGVAPTMKEWWG